MKTPFRAKTERKRSFLFVWLGLPSKLTVTKTEPSENALQRANGEKTELFISMVGPTIQELTVTKTKLFENALQSENGEKTEVFISTVGPTIQTNRNENGAFRKHSSKRKRRENGAFYFYGWAYHPN